ncbi:TetR/AcrR family transcriptional regulator [Christiangramia sp. OXR-203]|uniref:TetR/AcrR family transcriptional regulator n=1 Tax=Christiangramia sp. OXR-203 TaxID=3100176 RepID=UPI002AC8FEE5|nr:TetR/AcrR family transcriptional regulator [Christiangramia sp. OXR-203]WPY99788.1 TetR/AcrR family transcriptional regulator [Christiangramia sp. OXR-203]
MDKLYQNINISVNSELFLKDPESSELGKKIVGQGILLIDDIGFEKFTFKKLGVKIKSNESSIYRYFENKHKFLVYITNWFWGWKEFQLTMSTYGISNSNEKLLKAIEVITHPVVQDFRFQHINEVALNHIIINESSKSYLTKEVETDNKEGYFSIYKRLVTRIAEMISEVSSDYEYSLSLSSMVLDGALHQHFLKDHIQSITDCSEKKSVSNYFKDLVINTLKIELNG